MNIIRVISTKTPMNSIHDVYLPLSTLQNTLTDSAKLYNGGYISSQSYFPIISDPHDTIKLYNISEWKNRNYWLDWFHSETRASIYSKYKIIDNEQHIMLKARVPFNDFPLL